MPAFTDEQRVRSRFILPEEASLPSELMAPLIADAHAVLLTELDPAFAEADPAPEVLVLGETLLAGARVLRALASHEALQQRAQRLGSQTLQPGGRAEALRETARLAESEAWLLLAPYLRPKAMRRPADASDSQPVLGGA